MSVRVAVRRLLYGLVRQLHPWLPLPQVRDALRAHHGIKNKKNMAAAALT